jgi:hypothetical protein
MNPIIWIYFGFFVLLAAAIGGLVYWDHRQEERRRSR